jgi:DNA-binding protein WhiA
MSLSDELRDELASIAPSRRCCRLAELSALCHAAGSWHLHGHGELGIHLDLSSAAAARRAFALLRDLGVRSEIRTYRRRAFDRATRYQLHLEVDAGARAMLREAGVVSTRGAPLELPPKRVVGRSCCRGAYLRGAFLGAGTLSGPRSPHLELRATTRGGAELLAATAAREGAELRVLDRPTHAAAYAKGSETIADLVALAGAGETALRLDEHSVMAATRAEANRLANADEANVKRTVDAAQRQLEAIGKLDLELLPRGLSEIADLRIRHPELSLAELAARCRPPITKAAAHHRMATITRQAEEGELRGRTPPLLSTLGARRRTGSESGVDK